MSNVRSRSFPLNCKLGILFSFADGDVAPYSDEAGECVGPEDMKKSILLAIRKEGPSKNYVATTNGNQPRAGRALRALGATVVGSWWGHGGGGKVRLWFLQSNKKLTKARQQYDIY